MQSRFATLMTLLLLLIKLSEKTVINFVVLCCTHISGCRRQRKPPPKFEGTYSSFSGGEKYTAAKGDGVPIRKIGPIVRRLGAAHDGDAEVKLLHAAIYGNEGSPEARKEHLLDLQGLKGESAAANDNVSSSSHMLLGFALINTQSRVLSGFAVS